MIEKALRRLMRGGPVRAVMATLGDPGPSNLAGILLGYLLDPRHRGVFGIPDRGIGPHQPSSGVVWFDILVLMRLGGQRGGLNMLTYVVGDLFQSPAQVLVNTVNTVGVMGKGIAKEFKAIYPDMFKKYQVLCERGQLQAGKLWLYRTDHKWILNFPTKVHWRNPAKPEYIEAGLQKFVSQYGAKGISSISFPMLGCGNGELDWETQVHPLMERYLKDLPIDVYIHLYRKDPFAPEHREPEAIRHWLRSTPETLPFGEVWEDLQQSIAANPELTPFGDREPVLVTLFDEEPGELVLTTKGSALHRIAKDQLLELWHQLRSTGFSHPNSMPAGLDSAAPYVVNLLGRLPYLKQAIMSQKYTHVAGAHESVGIQLTPWIGRAPVVNKAETVEAVLA